MRRRWITSIVFFIVILSMLVVLSAVTLLSYSQNGITPSLVNSLATTFLVIITAWYAWSVRQQLYVANRQAKAAQAAYTPDLVINVERRSDDLILSIENRGEGTAKNIHLFFKITGPNYTYEYKLRFSSSLPPNHALGDNTSNPTSTSLKIIPKFKTPLQHDEDKFPTIRKLVHGDFNSIRTAYTSVDYQQLMDDLSNKGVEYPEVRMWAEYDDVLEERTLDEVLIEDEVAQTDKKDFDAISTDLYLHGQIVSSPQSRHEYLLSKINGLFGKESQVKITKTDEFSVDAVRP